MKMTKKEERKEEVVDLMNIQLTENLEFNMSFLKRSGLNPGAVDALNMATNLVSYVVSKGSLELDDATPGGPPLSEILIEAIRIGIRMHKEGEVTEATT